MASVNKVIIMGNCGRDPEIRYLPSGKAAATISVATSTRRKDRDSGEYIEDTQWHRVVLFDRLAEVAGEYLKKGKPVYFEGRIKYGKYTDKDGVERNTCDIVATEMQLLGGRDEGAQDNSTQRQQRPAPAAGQQRQAQRPVSSGGSSGFDDMDDDIPFADPMKRRAFALAI